MFDGTGAFVVRCRIQMSMTYNGGQTNTEVVYVHPLSFYSLRVPARSW
jgi:hypothetical protein